MDVTFSKLRKKGWFDEVAGCCSCCSPRSRSARWRATRGRSRRGSSRSRSCSARELDRPRRRHLAELLLQLLGTAAFLVPVVLAVTGWNRFRGKSVASSYGRLVGLLALVASLATLLDLLYGSIRYGGEVFPAGGYVGASGGDVDGPE
jgi:hypothetical protein